ncbi:pseudouridine synthase [Clostridium peptidivorans]|uniref:pseudouridine synthase n=1 Tax=Clostridium peptidivorans TaxID=100174 RepID=UPI000BE4699B|nr:pseudouridine synthase [Clostridium peptidivorans]
MERLQKFMARCGIASRRKCEEIILSGKVKVNNEIVKELGAKVNPLKDTVIVDGKLIKPEEKKLYIALNKPEGYLSTVKDDRGRKTLLDLVKVDERIYPIGRLDYDTSGLILLTNDGEIYNNIMHPRVEKNKRYIAVIKGTPDEIKLNKFKSGIDIGGYITAPSDIKLLKTKNNNTEVLITIHEGKNRQIRKMCEKIDHPVLKLKRVAIGNIELGNLEKGNWRFLTNEEVKYLKE